MDRVEKHIVVVAVLILIVALTGAGIAVHQGARMPNVELTSVVHGVSK